MRIILNFETIPQLRECLVRLLEQTESHDANVSATQNPETLKNEATDE